MVNSVVELAALHIEAHEGRVEFRAPDGRLLGAGGDTRVVPLLVDALTHLDSPTGSIDGLAVRGVCAFDITDTDLVAGRAGDGAVLVWRTPEGSVLGRADLTATDIADVLQWLDDLHVPVPAPPDWVTRRAATLRAIGDVVSARRRAEARGASTEELTSLIASITDLRRSYVADLPEVAIGRDPFDGPVVTAEMDNAGLDGPFWDAGNPARPATTMPPSFVVLSGAMRLSLDDLEHTDQLCLPGPAVPFVVPEVLRRDGVLAVLAELDVGAHTGYAISYFSPRPSEPPPLPNEWGRREYWLRDRGEPLQMGTSYDLAPSPDFDLMPWIAAGKLLWIHPGDETRTLQRTPEHCPFLGLSGERRHQRVQLGKVW
jgi:hypothetical protein